MPSHARQGLYRQTTVLTPTPLTQTASDSLLQTANGLPNSALHSAKWREQKQVPSMARHYRNHPTLRRDNQLEMISIRIGGNA